MKCKEPVTDFTESSWSTAIKAAEVEQTGLGFGLWFGDVPTRDDPRLEKLSRKPPRRVKGLQGDISGSERPRSVPGCSVQIH